MIAMTTVAQGDGPAGAQSPAVELATQRLRMRRWRDSDREPFAALNADPAVMEYFPALVGRASSDASIDAWQAQLAQRGWGNWAVGPVHDHARKLARPIAKSVRQR